MSQQKRSVMSPLIIILTLSVLFFVLFLMISGAFFLQRMPSKSHGGRNASARLFSPGSVGVIEINGVILDSKKILTRLEQFEDDDQIKSIVLRMNSPGGAVAPSQEIYEAVKSYSKPVVVSMSSVAASGAYYVACGAKKIFANPGTMTGSIGVIMEFMNLQKLYDWAKVERYALKSGKFKDVGADYHTMTVEDRELMQKMLMDILLQFKQAVAAGRSLSLAQVSALADGRIFSGSQAKAVHLVDELGTLKDAIQEAGKMAHIKGKPTVIYMDQKKKGILDFFLDHSSEVAESSLGGWRGLGRALGLLERADKIFLDQSGFSPGAYMIWGQGIFSE